MKSIGSRMYAIAPATSSLSVFETRVSVNRPPSSLRKFGSSFSVDITVRLAPVLGEESDDGSGSRASRARLCERDAPDAAPAVLPAGRLLRAEPALERVDWALTYADLPVAVAVESG